MPSLTVSASATAGTDIEQGWWDIYYDELLTKYPEAYAGITTLLQPEETINMEPTVEVITPVTEPVIEIIPTIEITAPAVEEIPAVTVVDSPKLEIPVIEIIPEVEVAPATVTVTASTPVIEIVPEKTAPVAEPVVAPTVEKAKVATTSNVITPVADPTTIVSNDEVKDMAKVIYREARGESLEGKIAVGAVVMNRVKTNFGGKNSISSVCKAPGQFASIGGVTDKMLEANPECLIAAQRALSGEDPTGGKLYFNSDKNSMKVHKSDRVYIGKHQFYS
jgi:spore germination cell wall hydrolase CwlJ-like protein